MKKGDWSNNADWRFRNHPLVELDQLLAESDMISLHCSLSPSTEGIINKESIAGMKDGVLLLNASRGLLVVEEDLRDALNSGKGGGAAVDVVSTEPIKMDNPLLDAKNSRFDTASEPEEFSPRLIKILNNKKEDVSQYICGMNYRRAYEICRPAMYPADDTDTLFVKLTPKLSQIQSFLGFSLSDTIARYEMISIPFNPSYRIYGV